MDDDPVVRGKAALALESCEDEVLKEGAEALLDQPEVEKNILACEILGFTRDLDFSDKLPSLLQHEDDRVVRSAIEIIPNLPVESAIPLLENTVDRYNENWKKALKRALSRIKNPEILSILERLFQQVDNNFKRTLVRIAAGLGTEESRNWVGTTMDSINLSEPQESVINWLLEADQ
jgi:HEAT repeat protein